MENNLETTDYKRKKEGVCMMLQCAINCIFNSDNIDDLSEMYEIGNNKLHELVQLRICELGALERLEEDNI